MSVEATYGPGPLGLALSQQNVVAEVAPGGQTDAAGVKTGMLLTSVSGKSVVGMPHQDVLGLIRAASRPMVLVFNSPAAAVAASAPASAAAPADSTSPAKAGPLTLAVPSKAAATQAAKKAGTLVKGIFGASVQVLAAFDRAIDKALDDSAKQARVSSRATVVCTRPPTDTIDRTHHLIVRCLCAMSDPLACSK